MTQTLRGSEYAELARTIKQGGLLRRRHGYYAVRISVNFLMLGAGLTAFFLLGSSWWQMLTAAFLAFVLTQFAFIGHDAGHRQIFGSRRANDAVGYLHGAMAGISYGWWVGKHTRHHANPNHEDADPDIDIPALSFSREQALAKRGPLRWVTKYQAFLFFPLLMTEAVMLRLASFDAVIRGEVKRARAEGAMLVANTAIYLTALFLVLTPLQAIVFIIVHQGLMGVYLGCAFAPNHKGMPVFVKEDELDFLRKQVLTSRNIEGRWWVDYLLGGLNYQIEHHLFPSMPRPNLRRAQAIVRDFCAAREISYTQVGLLASYAWVVRYLHEVGAPLRQPVPQS